MPVLDSLAGVIDSFALPGGVQIERYSSQIVDGYISAAAPTILNISPVVVHAAKGRDLLILPEGDRTKENIWVFSKVRFRTALEGSDEMPDIVIYTPTGEAVARKYVVKVAEDWLAQSGHFRMLCTRVPEN